MRLSLFFLLAAIVAAALCAVAPATAAELDSSAFSHQYNGDVYPVPNYTENSYWTVTPSSDGDILSYQPDIASGSGFFSSNQWAAAVSDAVGWTMEFRLKIGTDAAEGARGAFSLAAEDDGAGLQWGMLDIGQNKIATDGGVVIATVDNTDNFHTYRIAQDANTNIFKLWRDGDYLGSMPGTRNYSPDFYWADGSGDIGGPTVYLDYLRFDNTGAYDPVGYTPPPEPVVFYRENFANTTYAHRGLSEVGWQAHHGPAAVLVGGSSGLDPVQNSWGDGGTALPGVNSNSPEATGNGYTWHGDPSLTAGVPQIFWTEEYSLANVSEIEAIAWEQLHTNNSVIPQAAVRIGGNWYVTNETGVIVDAVPLFDLVELDFKAATWSSLNFTPSPRRPGDANNDGSVNGADAATLAENWLQTIAGGWSVGDFNNDGVVNDVDATIMATNWSAAPPAGELSLGDAVGSLPSGDITAFGLFIPAWPEGENVAMRFDNFAILGPTLPVAASVPEPSTTLLMILGAVAMLAQRLKN